MGAEADPYVLYSAYNGLGHAGYAGYRYAGLGYNYGLGYGHYAGAYAAAPVAVAHTVAAPVAVTHTVAAPVAVAAPLIHHAAAGYADINVAQSVNIAGLAPAAAPAVVGGYAAAGRYCANSAGVIHCA